MGQWFTYLLFSKSCISSTLIFQGSGYSHKGGGRMLSIRCTIVTFCQSLCPHEDKGILMVMHWDSSEQNIFLYGNTAQNVQIHFPRLSPVSLCIVKQHPSSKLFGWTNAVLLHKGLWVLAGFPLGLMFVELEVTTATRLEADVECAVLWVWVLNFFLEWGWPGVV